MKYNVWITLKKFGIVSGEVIIAGLLAYGFKQPWFLAVAPFLEAIRNYLEHYKNKA